jgi:hypothetical protein
MTRRKRNLRRALIVGLVALPFLAFAVKLGILPIPLPPDIQRMGTLKNELASLSAESHLKQQASSSHWPKKEPEEPWTPVIASRTLVSESTDLKSTARTWLGIVRKNGFHVYSVTCLVGNFEAATEGGKSTEHPDAVKVRIWRDRDGWQLSGTVTITGISTGSVTEVTLLAPPHGELEIPGEARYKFETQEPTWLC